MDNAITKNTMLVFLEDLSDATKLYFYGITTKAELAQKINTELLRGSWGNLVQGVLNSNKEIDFSITPLFDMESILAINSGSDFASGTMTVQHTETGLQVAGGKVTITGTPKTGTTAVKVFDSKGKYYVGTVALKEVTITTPPTDGAYVSVTYDRDVTGNILDLNGTEFPKNYKLWGYTIAVDPDTNEQISDVYVYLEKVMPDGNFTKTWEENKNSSMPTKFIAMTPLGAKSFGKYISVPVV